MKVRYTSAKQNLKVFKVKNEFFSKDFHSV